MVSSWFADDPGTPYAPRVLTNPSLDLAVAQGAAYYGVVRRGGGIRIGGGTARSFYVGFESEAAERPWLCVVPRDAQEGEEIAIAGHDFDLLMGQPVAFPLASSSVRPDDRPGDLVRPDPDSIRELPPLQGLMRVGRKAKAERVPVSLAARVTEVGTVELWCQSRTDDRRWRLQIQLRGPAGQPVPRGAVTGQETDHVVIEQSVVDAALGLIRAAFQAGLNVPPDAPNPSRVIKRLEEVLDEPRDRWPPSALRAFWEPLRELADHRLKSPQHESRWLNLAGFSLRPGRGFPLDDVRIKSLWPIFSQGVRHVKDVQCWAEWWILWRRVAAGLAQAHHEEIHRRLAAFLMPAKGTSPSKKSGRPRPEPHELAEMWRCAASLERLSPDVKEMLGSVLIKDRMPIPAATALWCLGRFGAGCRFTGRRTRPCARRPPSAGPSRCFRAPFAPGRETAEAVFALTQLARVANDRARDLDDALRQRVLARLAELGADEAAMRPVREYHELQTSQEGQALGDALPIGLRLISDAAAAEGVPAAGS